MFDKTKAKKDLSIPKKLKKLGSFFESINQYINFAPNLASLKSLLRPLLNKKSKFHWNLDHTKAFEKIKQKIINLTEKKFFDVNCKTRKIRRIAKRIRSIPGTTPWESKYSTNDLQLLGVVWAVKHYEKYLKGSDFEVITDHKALTSARSTDYGNKTYHSTLTRLVDRLLIFSFTVKHIARKDMGFTDLISTI